MAEKQKIPSIQTNTSETIPENPEKEFPEKTFTKHENTEEKVKEEAKEPISMETTEPTTEQNKIPPQSSAFEGIYDRLPDISIRSLDRFILLCVIGLAAIILIGILKAKHIL